MPLVRPRSEEPPDEDTLEDQAAELLFVFAGSPSKNPITRWVGGLVLPLAPAVWGLVIALRQEAAIHPRRIMSGPPIRLSGIAAVAYGLVFIALGFVLHFHFFYPNRRYTVAAKGKLVSIVCGFICLAYVLWRIVVT